MTEEMISYKERLEGSMLILHEVLDSTTAGMSLNNRIIDDPDATPAIIGCAENSNNYYLCIRKATYISMDAGLYIPRYGYYNLVDFITDVTKNLNSHLSLNFNITVEAEYDVGENMNMRFDASLLEKAIFDAVYVLVCKGKAENKKITISFKQKLKYVEFCVRTNYGVSPEYFSQAALVASGYASKLEKTTYAEIAAKMMGGFVNTAYYKNRAKFEINIPNDISDGESIMREQETVMRCGEAVMVFTASPEGVISDFFAGLRISEE